jgi:hypothetical protein
MGASGWSYVTAYRGDVAKSLRELRERVFRDKDYHGWDDLEEEQPRPATIEGIWASEQMKQSGTHSILDVSRVVETTAPPSWDNSREDLGTIRPLPSERVVRYFGTGRPSRARFEELAGGLDAASEDFITEVQMSDTGLYVLLYDGDTATEVGIWGLSGDLGSARDPRTIEPCERLSRRNGRHWSGGYSWPGASRWARPCSGSSGLPPGDGRALWRDALGLWRRAGGSAVAERAAA